MQLLVVTPACDEDYTTGSSSSSTAGKSSLMTSIMTRIIISSITVVLAVAVAVTTIGTFPAVSSFIVRGNTGRRTSISRTRGGATGGGGMEQAVVATATCWSSTSTTRSTQLGSSPCYPSCGCGGNNSTGEQEGQGQHAAGSHGGGGSSNGRAGAEVVGARGRIGSFLVRATTSSVGEEEEKKYAFVAPMASISSSNSSSSSNNTTSITRSSGDSGDGGGGEDVKGTTGDDEVKHFREEAEEEEDESTSQQQNYPGAMTHEGQPIYVAVPATSIGDVIQRTPWQRRNDLVFVTNGIPSDYLQERRHCCQMNDKQGKRTSANKLLFSTFQGLDPDVCTVTVPHFGVLNVGDDPISGDTSPPTMVYGRHSHRLQEILQRYGVKVKIVDSRKDVDEMAIRKLMWVSIMWLLCHDTTTTTTATATKEQPLTVSEVHAKRDFDLRQLVCELLPAANLLLEQYHPSTTSNTHTIRSASDSAVDISNDTTRAMMEPLSIAAAAKMAGQKEHHGIGSVDDVIEYMTAYSMSIPTAIPSKKMAIDEFAQRNGYLLSMERFVKQPLHKRMIRRVVGYIPRH